MRVELDPSACWTPAALTPLLNLVRCFSDDRHEWASTPAAESALYEFFTQFAAVVASSVRELSRKATVGSFWTAGRAASAVRIEASNLADTVNDLCREAVLVVEDIDTDGAFVEAIATVFAAQRVLTALGQRWLVIRHSGGTGRLPVVVNQERRAFRTVVRVAVLVDSDRMVPNQRTPIHDKADQLRSLGVAVHVLELREAENYLPNRVLARSGNPSNVSAKLTSLRLLLPQQRGHYDMKHGFGSRQGPPRIPQQQEPLFDTLPAQALSDLRGGFGNKLLPLLREHSRTLTVRDFATLGPAVEAELRALLSTIESVI